MHDVNVWQTKSILAVYLLNPSVHLDGTKIPAIAGMKYLLHSSCNHDSFFRLVPKTPTQAAAKTNY